jgi:hypothetical protein
MNGEFIRLARPGSSGELPTKRGAPWVRNPWCGFQGSWRQQTIRNVQNQKPKQTRERLEWRQHLREQRSHDRSTVMSHDCRLSSFPVFCIVSTLFVCSECVGDGLFGAERTHFGPHSPCELRSFRLAICETSGSDPILVRATRCTSHSTRNSKSKPPISAQKVMNWCGFGHCGCSILLPISTVSPSSLLRQPHED